MKFVSWNVNGLRAVLGKGIQDIMLGFDADAFCVQETKMQPEQMTHDLEGGYELFWNSAERKGYSGTATATRIRPQAVECGCFDNEGRILTLDLGPLYLVNVYSPNSQGELVRLPYRLEWEARFRDYLKRLDAAKPVVVCGDLNVAHNEIDLANPATNRQSAGFIARVPRSPRPRRRHPRRHSRQRPLPRFPYSRPLIPNRRSVFPAG